MQIHSIIGKVNLKDIYEQVNTYDLNGRYSYRVR